MNHTLDFFLHHLLQLKLKELSILIYSKISVVVETC